MHKETKEFKKLIEKANDILILTHQGPDPDAFCSSLLMKKFLNKYYPKKNVVYKSKQMPTDNYPFMDEITVVEKIEIGNEDLIIVCDIPDISRCFEVEDVIDISNKKIVYVDHHEEMDVQKDLIINHRLSSATEQVLALWLDLKGKNLNITKDLSKLAQIGIISDTGRFLYNSVQGDTYRRMGMLRDIYELDLEEMEYKSAKFPPESIKPLTMFLGNMKIEGDMSYYYLTDENLEDLKDTSTTYIKEATQIVKNGYLRFPHGVHWGFVLRPKFSDDGWWQVSFRSTNGYQDVDGIATQLGGGGHKRAAAATFEATSSKDALQKVLDAVNSTIPQN